ncbi:MAG TPA: hypothetical protein VFW64_02510 [Pseudonocardiaceae bacterium]|nr:hypothetical protein [Pseudonocardiaceae bacterium]
MRIPITKAVDAGSLAAQFTAALGIPVALSTRDPGQDDGKGGTLPGVVVLIDPATGAELPDQDAAKVAAVIAAHVIPPPPVTPHKALANALATAATPADVKTALMAFAGAVVTQEDQARQRQNGGRGGRGGGQGGGN